MTPQRTTALLFGIFGGIGAILVVIALVFVLREMSFEASAARAEGVVTGLVRRGRWGLSPVVAYEVDGRRYEVLGTVASSPPAFEVGERVPILYRRDDPADARIESLGQRWFVPMLLGGMGALFGGVPLAIWLVIRSRRKRRDRARSFGRPVRAKIISVEPRTSVRVNNRHPWVIAAEVPDDITGRTRTLESEYIWTPPLAYQVGGEVTVYVVDGEPGTYAFDLDKLHSPHLSN